MTGEGGHNEPRMSRDVRRTGFRSRGGAERKGRASLTMWGVLHRVVYLDAVPAVRVCGYCIDVGP